MWEQGSKRTGKYGGKIAYLKSTEDQRYMTESEGEQEKERGKQMALISEYISIITHI